MMRKMCWKPLAISVLILIGVTAAAEEPNALAVDETTLKEARVAADGPSLLDFFRKRTLNPTDLARIKELITQLGDDSFDARQNASAELKKIGPIALPLLKEAAKNPDIEVVRRAEDCLKFIEPASSPAVLAAAARVLAAHKPPETAEVLLAYLPGAGDEMVKEAVRGALAAVAIRDGTAEPVLVTALSDPNPVLRGGAGAALARAGIADQKAAVRKLLQDKEPLVRLHVGLALAEAKEKDALPVLIGLLDVLNSGETGALEEMLYFLAGDAAPTITPGTTPESRRRYREAWAEWWDKHGGAVDLAKLTLPARVLGFTMVVLLDEGKLQELDAAKKVRWHMENLEFPLDVQYLPGDRVLIAEQGASRVTERDLKGNILWQKQVLEPLAAQRLPNGRTMIANRQQVIEVDREGHTLATHTRPNGEFIMRAQKLRNGELALVVQGVNIRYVRIDASGKETASFPVQVSTSGGRIDVMPNGHVLVPEMRFNRVVEYDESGKEVARMTIPQPIAAIRLANGNMLVTSMTEMRAVELDRTGKQVWEYKHETRVSRAWRR
jgi:HEAT repeat protein